MDPWYVRHDTLGWIAIAPVMLGFYLVKVVQGSWVEWRRG